MITASLRRTGVAALILAAAINVSAGIVLVGQPARSRDLLTVAGWTQRWLIAGEDLYADPNSPVDYPPDAIVALSPLALVPSRVILPLWAALNICLAVAAPYLAARLIAPRASPIDIVTLTALFLCWSGTKTFLQFSLLALFLGLAAVTISDRRPVWSAILLAFASIKPQIAIPFVLWMLFARRWRILSVAFGVAIGLTVLFCVRARSNPLDVVRRYAEIVGALYTGGDSMVGASQLRPLLARLVPLSFLDVAAWSVAVVLLFLICVRGATARTGLGATLASLGLGAVWSLLTLRHLTYGFVLLLPTSALLLFAGDLRGTRFRTTAFWCLQAVLVVDIPGVWRRVAPWLDKDGTTTLLADADRLLAVALFMTLLALSRRLADTEAAAVYQKDHSCAL